MLQERDDEPRNLIQCRSMNVRGEETSDVVFETAEEDAGDGVLERDFLLVFTGLLQGETVRSVIGIRACAGSVLFGSFLPGRRWGR